MRLVRFLRERRGDQFRRLVRSRDVVRKAMRRRKQAVLHEGRVSRADA